MSYAKGVLVLVCLLLGTTLTARAYNTTCGSANVLIPDGRISERNTITGVESQYVGFWGVAGRSYAVEVHAEITPGGSEGAGTSQLVVTIQNVGQACGEVSTLTVRDTSSLEPRSLSSFTRLTFTAPSSGFYRIPITNPFSTQTFTFTVSISDTTLFSPRWSTFGGFYTSWGIQNTTNASCSVTLTVKNTAGTTLASPTFTVTAGQIVFRDTRATDLNVAANQAGQVTLTHDCPPGGIQADGFMSNEGGAVFVTIPVVFAPRTP